MERTIEVESAVRALVAQARVVLRDDPGCLVTDRASDEERRARAYTAAIGVHSSSGSSVHQDVVISFGRPHTDDDHVTIPLGWTAEAHARLLPSFEGELIVQPAVAGSRLVLRGRYHVPLGVVGAVADKALGHRVAEDSIEQLVQDMATRLDHVVDRNERQIAGWRPAPRAPDLRDQSHGGRSLR